jgi:hypothetical protein
VQRCSSQSRSCSGRAELDDDQEGVVRPPRIPRSTKHLGCAFADAPRLIFGAQLPDNLIDPWCRKCLWRQLCQSSEWYEHAATGFEARLEATPGVPRVCQDAQQRAVKRWTRRHIWDS